MDRVLLYGKRILEENSEIKLNRKKFNFDVDAKIEEILDKLGLNNYEKKINN